VGRLDQNVSWGDWLGGCGLDSTVSGQGPVAGCCECGDEPSGSCATELVSVVPRYLNFATLSKDLFPIFMLCSVLPSDTLTLTYT
jgi:hypothetical protein